MNRVLHVFISRQLAPHSPLQDWRNKNSKVLIRDEYLIEFKKNHFLPPSTSWLFFYSPKSVTFFFDAIPSTDFLSKKVVVMGAGTNATFLKYSGRNADIVGNGRAESIAPRIINQISQNDITFIRGSNSLRSLVNFLPEEYHKNERIVYQNNPMPKKLDINFDMYIFTSPMSVRSFFVHNQIGEGEVWSIGQTTEKELKKYGIYAAKIIGHPFELSVIGNLEAWLCPTREK